MKDSFVNSVLTIYSGLSPEFLIVEPTGVGKLSSIISNLSPLLHGDIKLLNPIAIVAPRSFDSNMSKYDGLYKDQIANAKTIVFSKCEKESADVLEDVTSKIRQINKDAKIINTHYTLQRDSWWQSLMDLTMDSSNIRESESESGASFSQVTLDNAYLNNPGELITLLEDCLRGSLGNIARAKGTIPVGSERVRFDLADGLYSISSSNEDINSCVFIGNNLDKKRISSRMGSLSIARHYVNRK